MPFMYRGVFGKYMRSSLFAVFVFAVLTICALKNSKEFRPKLLILVFPILDLSGTKPLGKVRETCTVKLEKTSTFDSNLITGNNLRLHFELLLHKC